ncbi:hypothetical protein SAMN05192552_10221 [Natrinema hispanicum]|uniref:Uncharacterized protein n=1 Tax=Natrinema hispanicum TaxID=392421 RepID=A0A1I0IP25_9EURY|nr:hypothetical protein SAMN05192552_10221 [Natrinema hispanicum]SET98889.1 hypothetical protein SAMN04488694_12339 [Natrinema hispanicum]
MFLPEFVVRDFLSVDLLHVSLSQFYRLFFVFRLNIDILLRLKPEESRALGY